MKSISERRAQLRRQIRKTRQNLTALEQIRAAQTVTQKALNLIAQRHAEHIGLYLSFDGEISTRPLIDALWAQRKNVYLPVLHPFCKGYMLFLHYTPETELMPNGLGIPEPRLNVKNILPINRLDIIFTPLVAFDKQGNRLGMGGGFYDRTLQDWHEKNFIAVGLAHQCQQVDELPVENWDIPLFDILAG
ncbi:5-formyltetrahydrofolate cyclo-ligase [Actinobacillus succinogenes]|uniref:5-formyltetrahydrofolate cyclo-ligase n=1 Tax=Actinobacillus succinogenes (strain ATCC 55618 / DSM 22257 / CCUG 43843 / 130Z) TaxID=339671 RepID=A6VM34_ACTSZ|nr:5-formyltetrahydrofolate cyclo-ligase [Actinobacillus succinogenes]ABR74031.1 5-formyltetrahydrofolate cyclo-ligase [Actinobacillus succinogenes 130Z]PHI39533.1 5-formyltetrahydrofolate cyclo-ligase [Actinobacillus succinogenes]